jgi:hypothetical protein
MQGIAPDPNWQRRVKAHRRIEAEPVFQLTRELQGDSAIPTFAKSPSHPGVQGISTRRSREVDELAVGDGIGVRASWRPIVVRIAGLLVLAAALLGSARIFGHSTARRQALSWVTLGHADVVLGAVR